MRTVLDACHDHRPSQPNRSTTSDDRSSGVPFGQLREAMATLAQHGLVHGDLSPYNLLATPERLVIIDLPQVIDLVGNPRGLDFLLRDCTNVCSWFRGRGLGVDEHELYGDLLASAF